MVLATSITLLLPFTLENDGRPISSERIRNGKIDRDGNMA
jgi:phosphopantetheine adenylyltransferase